MHTHIEDTRRLATEEVEMLQIVLYLVIRKRSKVVGQLEEKYSTFQCIKKEKGGESLFIYGCCPGGALPAGFVAGSCVNPPPWHTGCCPPG